VLSPSISSGNNWQISYSNVKVRSLIAFSYYVSGNNGYGTTIPIVTGATVVYSNFYNYVYNLVMVLKVTSPSVSVSGSKPNTGGMNGMGASFCID
jgi:hypothetical protein